MPCIFFLFLFFSFPFLFLPFLFFSFLCFCLVIPSTFLSFFPSFSSFSFPACSSRVLSVDRPNRRYVRKKHGYSLFNGVQLATVIITKLLSIWDLDSLDPLAIEFDARCTCIGYHVRQITDPTGFSVYIRIYLYIHQLYIYIYACARVYVCRYTKGSALCFDLVIVSNR